MFRLIRTNEHREISLPKQRGGFTPLFPKTPTRQRQKLRLCVCVLWLGTVGALMFGLAACSNAELASPAAAPVPAPVFPPMAGAPNVETAQVDVISPVAPGALPEIAFETGAVAAAGADGSANVNNALPGAANREVIVRGFASLRAADPLAAAAQLADITETSGGFVESRSETRPTGQTQANAFMVLRIPAAQMTATVAALDTLGDVTNVEISREDVTATVQDLNARIAALETSTARLTELMAGATTTADLLAAERELASRQGELDSLNSFRGRISEQVAMSTLEVNIQSTEGPWAQPQTGLAAALSRGWQALIASGQWLLVALATALPWLAAITLLVWLFRLLLHAFRNRRHPKDVVTGGYLPDVVIDELPGESPGQSAGESAGEPIPTGRVARTK